MVIAPPTAPCTLTLSDDSSNIVECLEILRNLPGKRLVCRGQWQGHAVLIKLYLHPQHGQRHCQREKAGVTLLKSQQIATPKLLHAGRLRDNTPILIFDYLNDAATSLELWQQCANDSQRLELLFQLMRLLAQQHNCGLWQQDLHLGNFLHHQGTLYSIDGDDIVKSRHQAASITERRQNLALFLAQLAPHHDHLFSQALSHYASGPRVPSADWSSLLNHELPQARTKRRHTYVKKSYRNCSEFVRQKNQRQLLIYRRDIAPELLLHLQQNPDALIKNGTLLKDGNSATVARIELADQCWVIKRYNIKNIWHALKRCWRPTRASISWGNAHRLKISDIATPKAVAMIEKRFGPLRFTGYYVCEFVAGPSVAEYYDSNQLGSEQKQQTAAKLVELFSLFFRLGIYHGDCKATNFLVRQSTPWVIDLDAMREFHRRRAFLRHFGRDRQRFLRNWPVTSDLYRWFAQRLPGQRQDKQ